MGVEFKAVNGPNSGGYVALDDIMWGDGENCEIVPHTANPGVDPGDCSDDQFACHDGTCVPKVRIFLSLPAAEPRSQGTIIIVPVIAIHTEWACVGQRPGH